MDSNNKGCENKGMSTKIPFKKVHFSFFAVLMLLLLTIAAAAWFNDVQQGGPYVLRNLPLYAPIVWQPG